MIFESYYTDDHVTIRNNNVLKPDINTDLLKKYISMLELNSKLDKNFNEDVFGLNTSKAHMVGLLQNILNTVTSNPHMAYQQLGYVQALMVIYGYISVDDETNPVDSIVDKNHI